MGGRATIAMTIGLMLVPAAGQAQSVEDFYRGKTLTMVIGYPTGGSNDIYARTVGRHIGKHIPGHPTVIPNNMPGGGSLIAANYLFNTAAKDGTVLGLTAPTIVLEERLGVRNVKLKSAEFNWIGRVAPGANVGFVWHTVPVKTIADAMKREVIFGASARSSTVAIYPSVLAHVIGAKIKIVMGYKGSTSAMLAMERGEIEGHSTSFEILRAVHPDWLPQKKIIPLVQFAMQRQAELPDVPTSWELGRNDEEQQILKLVAKPTEIGKLILSPPGMPADRVRALRRAFDETMKDPEFIADLHKQRVELGPMSGEALQTLVSEVAAISPAIIEKVKKVYPLN